MQRLVRTPTLLLMIPVLATAFGLTGCGPNAQILQGQNNALQQQQIALANQSKLYQTRINSLDRDHQELEQLLAQTRQQAKISEDKASALRQQLSDVTKQLAKVSEEKADSEKQVKAMTASMQREGRISISPNSSVRSQLPDVNLPGVDVRRDGDVIRVVLPADRLFEPNAAMLRSDALPFLSQVASELQRVYPSQMIGVEAHTDRNTSALANYRNTHELSVAWAVAVYNHLTSQTRLQPNQLTVAGHGSNYPAYSNASAGGAQRNRRVELVVYPDRMR